MQGTSAGTASVPQEHRSAYPNIHMYVPADHQQYLFSILTVILSNSVLSHASSASAPLMRTRLTKKGIRASFVLVGNRDESTEI